MMFCFLGLNFAILSGQQWRMQAEVNDEVERLLQSTPVLTDAA
jgi:hypothetical protein